LSLDAKMRRCVNLFDASLGFEKKRKKKKRVCRVFAFLDRIDIIIVRVASNS
jgi:hypothetical protein